MFLKEVLVTVVVVFFRGALVEKTNEVQYGVSATTSHPFDHILTKLDDKLELRLKLTDLDSKLKQLEQQNTQIQKTLEELKQILTSSPSGLHSLWKFPRDCKEVQDRGGNISDIYRIQPDPTSSSFLVLCDMRTRGGGWTYVMNRYDGSQDFNLEWKEYKEGFGHLAGEFWLGLENLRRLTGSGKSVFLIGRSKTGKACAHFSLARSEDTASSQVSELLIELVDWDMKRVYAHYKFFSIASEQEGYRLKLLAEYSGDAGDSFSRHVGKKFSTKDRDQDRDDAGNCASYRYGGWWYDNCFFCKLTGKYLKGNLTSANYYQGIHWPEFRGNMYSLKQARMMVRPRDSSSPIQLPHEKII